MNKLISDADQSFLALYRKATDSNQTDAQFKEVLLACALAKPDDAGFFTPTIIIEPLSSIMKKQVTHANFQRHLHEFIADERGAF